MLYVSYRDFAPAVSDVAEGRIDVVSTALTQLIPYQQMAKIRLLAVINRTRSDAAPDVPTGAEAGFPDLAFDGVTGFFGWRGITPQLRDRIASDVQRVSGIQALRDRLPTLGIVARGSNSAEFAAAIEEQRAKIAAIAQAIGTKPVQ